MATHTGWPAIEFKKRPAHFILIPFNSSLKPTPSPRAAKEMTTQEGYVGVILDLWFSLGPQDAKLNQPGAAPSRKKLQVHILQHIQNAQLKGKLTSSTGRLAILLLGRSEDSISTTSH